MNIWISVALIASSIFGSVSSGAPRIKASDLKRLTGAQWTGTLTYLDYSKNTKVSIPANLTVSQSAEHRLSWIFEYTYPDEPQANTKRSMAIAKDGRTFGDELIVERTTLPDKTIKIVTNKNGKDNDKPAVFRFTYLLSDKVFSLKKEVSYDGSNEFFERNEYSWKR